MPQRFLRPGIRTSAAWNAASFPAQGLYVAILTLVDDFGRYDGRAQLLHGECFSLRNDIKAQRTATLLRELNDVGLIQLYEHGNKEYLQVLRWQERTRTEKSKFPDPPVGPQESAADRRNPQGKDASLAFAITSKPSPSSAVLRFPANAGDEVKELFGKWMGFRRGIGKKPKDWHAMFQEQLNWLGTKPRSQWKEILSQSIRNGWQGLFDAKPATGKRSFPEQAKIDPSKIDLPGNFKSWAIEVYPEQRDSIASWQTWADVTEEIRKHWWGEQRKLLAIA